MNIKLLDFLKRISFHRPKIVNFIIFDATNADLIVELIPNNPSFTIFKTRPTEINVTPKIFYNFILNLKYFKIKECLNSRKEIIYKVLWQLQMFYIKVASS